MDQNGVKSEPGLGAVSPATTGSVVPGNENLPTVVANAATSSSSQSLSSLHFAQPSGKPVVNCHSRRATFAACMFHSVCPRLYDRLFEGITTFNFQSYTSKMSNRSTPSQPVFGAGSSNTVIDRRRIQDLVKEVDPMEQLDEDVEEVSSQRMMLIRVQLQSLLSGAPHFQARGQTGGCTFAVCQGVH